MHFSYLFLFKNHFWPKFFSFCWDKLDFPGSIVYLSCFDMKPHSSFLRIIYLLNPKTQEKQHLLRFAYSFLNDWTFIYRALYTMISSVFYIVKITITNNKIQLIKFNDTDKRQNNGCYYSIYKISKTFKNILAKIIVLVKALVKIVTN